MTVSEPFPERPDPVATLTGSFCDRPFPKAICTPGCGGKFDTRGNVLPWPGNTFLCHIDRMSAAFRALVDVQDRVRSSEFGRYFTYLPPESFHVTVFQGWSPFLKEDGIWPEGLGRDVTRDEMTSILRSQVSGLILPQGYRIRSDGLFALHSLTVRGADNWQERSLRYTRNVLRDATRICPKDFDGYVFHISLGYQLRWVGECLARDMVAFSDELGRDFEATVPEIQLGPCELCSFDTMHHFEPVRLLSGPRTRRRHVSQIQGASGA